MWKKIITFLGYALGLLFGAVLLNAGRKSTGKRPNGHEREIVSAIAGQGKQIDSNIARVERIETIIGDNEERERSTQSLVDESRDLRQRAKKLLDGGRYSPMDIHRIAWA